MRIAWRLLLPILFVAPCAASAHLPVLLALDGRTKVAIQRQLEDAGYAPDSVDLVEGAIIGAVQQEEQPALNAYRFPDAPYVNASSRASGRCQQVEATIWVPDGRLPPLRLRGRYCEHGTPGYTRIWRATSQHIRTLDEDELPPAVAPPVGAMVQGP